MSNNFNMSFDPATKEQFAKVVGEYGLTVPQAFKLFANQVIKTGLSSELIDVLHALIHDTPLPAKYKDRQLTGNLKAYRECHLRPDLLLAYQSDDEAVRLITIDNHNNLFKTLSNR